MENMEEIIDELQEYAKCGNDEVTELWGNLIDLWWSSRAYMSKEFRQALELEITNERDRAKRE
ncbi:MAG: hypothetical protein ACXABV_16820, partial [Candidatus Thorarchaeota archaeon]